MAGLLVPRAQMTRRKGGKRGASKRLWCTISLGNYIEGERAQVPGYAFAGAAVAHQRQ